MQSGGKIESRCDSKPNPYAVKLGTFSFYRSSLPEEFLRGLELDIGGGDAKSDKVTFPESEVTFGAPGLITHVRGVPIGGR